MKKKNILFISLMCVFLISFSSAILVLGANVPEVKAEEVTKMPVKDKDPVATFSEVYIPSEPSDTEEKDTEVIILELVEVERVEPATLDEATTAAEIALQRNANAGKVYDGLISLGYNEEHPAVVLAKTEVNTSQADYEYYIEKQNKIAENLKWEKRAAEYPVATQAWLYMKNEFGWSDEVCAGIIGNFMAECGGCWTSDLQPNINNAHGLGMAQWIGGRRTQLIQRYGSVPSVEAQLNFVKDELYGTNGVTRQVNDYQFNQIINAETPEASALAFATYFERCAEQHRAPRQGYARTAYEYFVD